MCEPAAGPFRSSCRGSGSHAAESACYRPRKAVPPPRPARGLAGTLSRSCAAAPAGALTSAPASVATSAPAASPTAQTVLHIGVARRRSRTVESGRADATNITDPGQQPADLAPAARSSARYPKPVPTRRRPTVAPDARAAGTVEIAPPPSVATQHSPLATSGHDAGHRPRRRPRPRRHRVLREAVQEVHRPVDRVDHPGDPAGPTASRALLAEEAVVGPGGQQAAPDQRSRRRGRRR